MHSSPVSVTPRGTPSRRGKSPRFTSDIPAQAGSSTLPTSFSNKPPATFTTSLSIRVEGATPIDPSEPDESPRNLPPESLPSPSQPKRTPRKSKTDAIAALQNQARSPSPSHEDYYSEGLSEQHLNGEVLPVSPCPTDVDDLKKAIYKERKNALMHVDASSLEL